MNQDIRVPDIGDAQGVRVAEILVRVGDAVTADQHVITVESDKAAIEISADSAGYLSEVLVSVGDTVAEGDVIARVSATQTVGLNASSEDFAMGASEVSTAPTPAARAGQSSSQQVDSLVRESGRPFAGFHATPSARKRAMESAASKGASLDMSVPVSDAAVGAILFEQAGNIHDTSRPLPSGQSSERAAGLNLLAWPKVNFERFGDVERKDLSRIKKISGANLHRNWVMIPHVTNNDEADVTALEAFRVSTNKENEKSGVKVTMLAFVIKAVVAALKKFPEFNTSLDGDTLVYKQYFHIGFAADTPNGLVVPVLKDADKKGILQISQEMGELAKKARDGKLGAADMQGGCFSISSLGGIGGTHFTPIINAPEVAILGLSKSYMKPVWDGKQFVPQLTLPLSLSYDHRVIDGASAARFNTYLGQMLADIRREHL